MTDCMLVATRTINFKNARDNGINENDIEPAVRSPLPSPYLAPNIFLDKFDSKSNMLRSPARITIYIKTINIFGTFCSCDRYDALFFSF